MLLVRLYAGCDGGLVTEVWGSEALGEYVGIWGLGGDLPGLFGLVGPRGRGSLALKAQQRVLYQCQGLSAG